MRRAPGMVVLAVAVWLGGCLLPGGGGEDPTRFYVLSPPQMAEAGAGPAEANGLHVGLRRIELVRYLDHPGMVTRRGAHEIDYAAYRRWAEPLPEGVSRVLAAALEAAPGVSEAVKLPAGRSNRSLTHQVRVLVEACEGALEEDRAVARFFATWEILSADGGRVLAGGRFRYEDPGWDGSSHAQLAGLLSDAVHRLAGDLVEALGKG